jgi:hypothetical protein
MLADPPACRNSIGAAAALNESCSAEFTTHHGMIEPGVPGRSI